MPSLALTGTIGSGKTSAAKLIASEFRASGISVTCFSADEENRRLLETDPEVKDLVLSSLGPACYTTDGRPDRNAIFRIITGDPAAKNALEGILHPRIGKTWKPLAEAYRHQPDAFFIAEIPLLYEKDFARFFDKVLVVGCSDSLRKERLLKSRSITAEKADEWMALQQSQDDKISKTDHLLWNDGSMDSLKRQIQSLLQILTKA